MQTDIGCHPLAPLADDGIPDEQVSFFSDAAALAALEPMLEEHYQNIYSSIAQFRASGRESEAHGVAVSKNGAVSSLFLFHLEKNAAIVMNEAIRVTPQQLYSTSHHIFKRHDTIDVVRWHAIQSEPHRLPLPHQRWGYSEDIVVSLPATEAEYAARLGKATRKNLVRHRNRLTRDFPSLRHAVHAGEAIQEHHLRQIVALNRARMERKHKTCGFDDEAVRRALALARSHGMISLLEIDGRICGGSICYRVGANYFMELSAHDPAYDSYRLGMLCCYLAICEAIARGGREMHLLWGRDEYKFQLLGERRDLVDVCVYRSHFAMLRHAPLVMRSTAQAALRWLKLALHDGLARDAFIARAIRRLLDFLRAASWFRPGRA